MSNAILLCVKCCGRFDFSNGLQKKPLPPSPITLGVPQMLIAALQVVFVGC